MKYANTRPYADPEKAARRLLEIASTVEPVHGRIVSIFQMAPEQPRACALQEG